MTVEEFKALPEKEKIDLIGWKVMGWTPGSGHMAEWNPIQEMGAAWSVEERIMGMEGHIQVGYVSALYQLLDIPFDKMMNTGNAIKLIHASQLNRCIAGLKAVGVIE